MTLNRAFEIAHKTAINKTMRKMITQGVKEVRKKYNIKAKDLKQSIKFVKASGRRPSAEMHARASKIPLKYFRPKITATGVKVTIKQGSTKEIKHAFIAKMKYSLQIYKRTGKGRGTAKALYTIGVATMFDMIPRKRLDDIIKQTLVPTFEHEIKRLLMKK